MSVNKNFLILFFFLSTKFCLGQNILLPNEKLLFSFQTENNKNILIACDTNYSYIIYRLIAENIIEQEFPTIKNKESWAKFEYSYWLRGGGVVNEGLDINFLAFTDKNVKYVIYDTYYAIGNESKIGVKATDLITNKTTDSKGVKSTRKGNLVNFRDNKLISVGDELYE